MIVTIISKNYIRSISLPEKIKGQFWLYESVAGKDERLVNIEGVGDEWIMKSTRQAQILDNNNNTIKNTVILPQNIYVLIKLDGEKIFVFAEPITEDRQIFTKYLLRDDADLTIGRNEQNDICYMNKVVSSRHASLSYRGGSWFIQDLESSNGTFVNGDRVKNTQLHVGDVVFIMGFKIIIGKNLIAFNNPDGQVKVSERLKPFVSQPIEDIDEEEEYELAAKDYFYRSPRFKRDVETAIFKIDSPPTSPISEEMPWFLVMGSSMAMGMMSVVTLTTAIITKNITSMVMGGSMLVGTLLIPTITKAYEKNRKRKKEVLRQKKYREYLDRVTVQINETCQLQEEILNENHVTIQECEKRIQGKQRNLWERGIGQNDFLRVRIGNGEGVLDAEIRYSERKFTLDDDNLQEELYTLCEKEKALHDIPITYYF